MSPEVLLAIAVSGLVLLAVLGLVFKKAPKRLNQTYFQKRWLELLGKVKSPEGMIIAVIDADKLLDDALKKRNFRGKTMGERMVAAQRTLTDNDAAWFAHKLRNRLVHEPDVRLKQSDAKQALSGFKQALKDLGAL